MKQILIQAAVILLLFSSCSNNSSSKPGSNNAESNITPVINYALSTTYLHDTSSFTEGFLMHHGKLYESTGFTNELPQTRSLFGEVDLKTGKINIKAELDKRKYFGEGIVFFDDKIYQLTYQTKIGFVYDAKTFKQLNTFSFPSNEGWGMTTDSINLIMSDGTNSLTYLEPSSLNPVKKLNVEDENGPVENINELEYIKGFIYANVYTTNYIIKINPANGKVVGRLDLISLKTEQNNKFPGSGEMNGIAYDPATDKVFITGKLWSNIYEIKFTH